jgi:hypothetical protein
MKRWILMKFLHMIGMELKWEEHKFGTETTNLLGQKQTLLCESILGRRGGYLNNPTLV